MKVLQYYPDDKLHKEFHTRDGKKEGLYREWRDDGKLVIECNFVNDKKEGPFRLWDIFVEEGNYTNGKKNGVCKTFSKDGTLLLGECAYLDGELHGYCREWDREELFERGRIVGKILKWHSNGVLKSSISVKKGACTKYFDNGNLHSEFNTNDNGNYEGELVEWYDDGKNL